MMDEENKPVGILIDEIEGLIGSGDKGGFSEFLDLLKSNVKYEDYVESLKNKKKSSKKKNVEQRFIKLVTPILCTSIDSNEKKIQELKKYSEIIFLQPPIYENVKEIIDDISEKENMRLNEECKEYIYNYINGDIRKLIITLEQIKYRYFREENNNEKIVGIDDIKLIFSYLSEKDEDDSLLKETQKILERDDLTYDSCKRIFEKECLLIPLTVYQNSIHLVKNSKMNMKNKIEKYRRTLDSLCVHDNIQTFMFKNDFNDYGDDELYENACLYSTKIPNYYMKDMKAGKIQYENTNLLNKISQMLVNKKLVMNTRKSIEKLNLESDEILYVVHILSHFLGDLKETMNLEVTNEENEEEVMKPKREEMKGEIKNFELMNIMNKYGISMEELETIMKIEKLNKEHNVPKKKKFTVKLKKEIENQLC